MGQSGDFYCEEHQLTVKMLTYVVVCRAVPTPMSEKSVKIIRGSLIALLVITLIVALVEPLRVYVITQSLWIWQLTVKAWFAVMDSYALPGWAWILLLILALYGLIRICLSIFTELRSEAHRYTEDHLLGAVWRWRWRRGSIRDLWCFCPDCDSELVYDGRDTREFKTDFNCENCDHKMVTTIGGDVSYAKSVVEREIKRRVRTGEYKIVQPDKEPLQTSTAESSES